MFFLSVFSVLAFILSGIHHRDQVNSLVFKFCIKVSMKLHGTPIMFFNKSPTIQHFCASAAAQTHLLDLYKLYRNWGKVLPHDLKLFTGDQSLLQLCLLEGKESGSHIRHKNQQVPETHNQKTSPIFIYIF